MMRPLSCRHWVPRGQFQDHTSSRWELCAFLHEAIGRGRFLGVLASVERDGERWIAKTPGKQAEHVTIEDAIKWTERILEEQEERAALPTIRDLGDH